MSPTLRARAVKLGFLAALEVLRRTGTRNPPPSDAPEEELHEFALALRAQMEAAASRLPAGRHYLIEHDASGPVDGLWVADTRAVDLDADEAADLEAPADAAELVDAEPPDAESADAEVGTTIDPASAERVVLHLHGGAYVMGSPETHRGLAAALSRAACAPVFLPRYRLAPEHVFPAALDDAVASYRWLVEDVGIPPERIAVTGDSAGGGLALALQLALLGRGLPLPACSVVLSPWTDLAATGASLRELDDLDPWLSADLVLPAARAYAGTTELTDPLVSPLYGDLAGLPPLLVHVGSDEILLDDAVRFVERAREADVDASLGQFDGLWHVFQAFPMPESRQSLDEIGAFIRRHTSPVDTPEAASVAAGHR